MNNGEREPIMKTRRIFCAIAALLPWSSASPASWFGSGPPKPPLIVPFAVHKAGTIFTTELEIVDHRSYRFSLRLGFKEHDKADRDRVEKLAGKYGRDKNGNLLHPGIAIPLKVNISVIDSSGERTIYDQKIVEEEMYGYGADHYSKTIGAVALRPGHYRFTIESMQDIPELTETPVSLGIGWAPKTSPIKE